MLVILSLIIIRPLLLAILMGMLLAYVFTPVYRFVTKKIKQDTIAAVLVCFFVLLLLIIPGFFLVKLFVKESYVIYLIAKQKLAIGIFNGCEKDFCVTIQNLLHDPEIHFYLQNILKSAANYVVEKGTSFIVSIPHIFLNIFVMFFTMYYFLKEGGAFVDNLNNYLRLHNKKYVHILNRLRDIVKGIVFGYGIIAIMQGMLGALGFWMFGISSPLVWGVIMTFLALIPFLGTGVVWVPAALLLFFEGMVKNSNLLMVKAVGLFIYCLIFVSTLDNFVRPKVIGNRTKIHPLIVMMGIFGGMMLLGPVGVIVGPLILSLAMVFIEVYILEKIKKK
ncbi:AI-2E family transporter [Candidatus Woesearchaeota archaeon]|nr:AI-2E family transporter [Candidatus Woesearchaeota archaeon]